MQGRQYHQAAHQRTTSQSWHLSLGLWVADPPAEIYDWNDSVIRLEVVRLDSEGMGSDPLRWQVTCEFDLLDDHSDLNRNYSGGRCEDSRNGGSGDAGK